MGGSIARSCGPIFFLNHTFFVSPFVSGARYYLCLGFEHGYRAPTPMTSGVGAGKGAGGGGNTVQHSAAAAGSSSSGEFGEDKAKQSKAQKRNKSKAGSVKGKDWIMAKKEKRRAQNKETRRDSKYTGRKRKDKF